jgi:Ser/Thr protein kinase RdoA (MazF antagonist)
MRRWQSWTDLVATGWRPALDAIGLEVVERAWRILTVAMPLVPALLQPWRERVVPLHSCLCDCWHDHVLYTGDEVTGIIDYGALQVDNVAVDLARMLGSMAVGPDARNLRTVGLQAYRELRPLPLEMDELIDVLDQTGQVVGAASWLLWLGHEKGHVENVHAAQERLNQLLDRIDRELTNPW